MPTRDETLFSLPYKGGTITGRDDESVRRLIAELEAGRRRDELRRATWPGHGRERMAALGRLFPTLREVPGIDPWEPEALIEWLNGPAPGHGAACAGRFLLGVWNPGTDWTDLGLEPPGHFDLFEAMACWDREHVGAMLKWLESPFFP